VNAATNPGCQDITSSTSSPMSTRGDIATKRRRKSVSQARRVREGVEPDWRAGAPHRRCVRRCRRSAGRRLCRGPAQDRPDDAQPRTPSFGDGQPSPQLSPRTQRLSSKFSNECLRTTDRTRHSPLCWPPTGSARHRREDRHRHCDAPGNHRSSAPRRASCSGSSTPTTRHSPPGHSPVAPPATASGHQPTLATGPTKGYLGASAAGRER
jgi:hypothetical protein